MKKHLLVTTAFVGMMYAPALAQTQAPPATSDQKTMDQKAADQKPATDTAAVKGSFVSEQTSSQWLASSLMGATVYGPDDKAIGEINDLVIDTSGAAEAAVIGVGGFLGMGEKNVAIGFKDLKVMRKDNGKVDKVMLSMTKDELKNAPSFMTFAEKQSRQDRTTTGSTNNPNALPGAAKKPVQ